MDITPQRALLGRLATARLARQLYLGKLAATVADGRDLCSSSAALVAEARVAYAVACRRREAATTAWP